MTSRAAPNVIDSADPALVVGKDGRLFLQRRLGIYLLTLFLFYVSYWPGFYLIWASDPSVGPRVAWEHVTHWSAASLGIVYALSWLVMRLRAWPAAWLLVMDVAISGLIGLAFAAIVLHHPNPLVAAIEGVLALATALWIRVIAVPSSHVRSALASALMCLSPALLLFWQREHFSASGLAFSTVAFVFVNWSLIIVAICAFASSVLYGLRREVRSAQRFGQYTLLEKLGEGAMGVVYRARHAMLRRPTALKLLNSREEASLLRFEREVQLMAELTHPNTVTVHDYGRTEDGVFYYAMEFLNGMDLESLVEIGGPQPAARVIHLLRQACGALSEAHTRGLIHRDIKPSNMFVCKERGTPDMVKVLDFGVVKDLRQGQDGNPNLSTQHALVGTPLYLSPESINNPKALDARSDLYALGAVGYLLLTGVPVFDGKTLVAICAHHLYTPAALPSDANLPPDLARVILRCLEKSPDQRYPDAAALSKALSECTDEAGWTEQDARAWWSQYEGKLAELRAARASAPDSWAAQTVAVAPASRLKHQAWNS